MSWTKNNIIQIIRDNLHYQDAKILHMASALLQLNDDDDGVRGKGCVCGGGGGGGGGGLFIFNFTYLKSF